MKIRILETTGKESYLISNVEGSEFILMLAEKDLERKDEKLNKARALIMATAEREIA